MIVLPLNCAVTDRIAKGIRFEQEPRPMTVVSIDSIDILQCHAMVSSRGSEGSWHGTLVHSACPTNAQGFCTL